MRPPECLVAPILAAIFCAGANQDRPPADGTEASRPAGPKFEMTPAVAVTRVDGFEQFVTLPGSRLTSEDKLKVYFRPINFKVEPTKAGYHARFVEDGRVRRKGEKTPLSKEDRLLEYEARFTDPTYRIYLVNTIGLKELPPGEYEFDIILHDALAEDSTATQTLPFTIIPTPKPDPATGAGAPDAPEEPAAPAEKKAGSPRKGKPRGSPAPRR